MGDIPDSIMKENDSVKIQVPMTIYAHKIQSDNLRHVI